MNERKGGVFCYYTCSWTLSKALDHHDQATQGGGAGYSVQGGCFAGGKKKPPENQALKVLVSGLMSGLIRPRGSVCNPSL